MARKSKGASAVAEAPANGHVGTDDISQEQPEEATPVEATTGRPYEGQPLPQALAEAWSKAYELTAALPSDAGYSIVPIEAVEVRMDILPRDTLDEDAVDRYAANFEDTPPIDVQKGTLALIDGRHRLAAAARAISEHIKVRELDVADGGLFYAALVANTKHGMPLSTQQRMDAANRLLAERPDLSKTDIAKIVGMGRVTLWRWQQREQEAAGETVAESARTVKMRDWLKPLERMTVGSSIADIAADDVPDEQVRERLVRVGTVREWLDAYYDTLNARAATLPEPEQPAAQPDAGEQVQGTIDEALSEDDEEDEEDADEFEDEEDESEGE